MADRADYLARILMRRLLQLQASCVEDGRGEADRRDRLAVIEKILAVELGVTDGLTLATIEGAMPNAKVAKASEQTEVRALADFLRRRLGSQLSE